MIDVTWQLQAMASIAVAIPVGVALRRGLDELDQRRDVARDARAARRVRHEHVGQR
jgi:hypothetical protein